MTEGNAFHFVCTREEADRLSRDYDRFWASNCGCREGLGAKCKRSRMDVCLLFSDDFPPTGSGKREIGRDGVEAIFREAREKHLVTRPFRNDKDPAKVDGICFCCDDCCGYFQNPGERCDKGACVETTDADRCSDCGLCVEACPEDCIEMIRKD